MPSWKKIIVSGSSVSQLNNDSGFAKTGSANTFYGNQTVNGDVVVTGSITALQYIISSSVIYVTESNFSGSHVFGNTMDDTHQFTGSVYITGSLTSPNITGSLLGTASYVTGALFTSTNLALSASHAISSSYALSSSYASTASYVNPLTQDVIITGSVLITGSIAMNAPTASISGVDYIDFDTAHNIGTTAPPWKEGRLFYDTGSGALAFYNWEQDVTLNIGQEQWLRARNQTGVNIPNGTVVRLVGALGDRPTIEPAQSTDQTNTFSTNNEIIGMTTHLIEHGTDGFVTTFGLVNGLDTSMFAAGDILWVSQSAGLFTNIPPPTPYDRTFVGIVAKANPATGAVFVTPLTPIHFHDISSVSASTYQQGDLWMYRSGSTGQANAWINTKHLTGSYIITGSLVITGSLTTNDGLYTQTITSSFISASGGITGSLYGTALTASYYGGALSNAQLPSQINVTGVSASFTGSLVGALTGTASWATSASQAVTASYLPIGTYSITSSWAQSSSQALTASYTPNAIVTASISSNTLTFVKGDGNTFNLTVNTGSGGGTPGGAVSTIQFNSASAFSGSSNFTFNSGVNQVQISGSIIVSGSGGKLVFESPNPRLYDSSNIDSFDWNGRGLYDTTGVRSILWGNRTLKTSGDVVSVDWENRYLYAADGTTIVTDWNTNQLKDASGTVAVDWENRQLTNTSGNPLIKWNDTVLYDAANGVDSVHWIDKKTKDNNGNTSINWDSRILYDLNGNEVNQVLNWSDSTTSNGVRLYGTASVALNVPKAGGVLAASFGGSPLTASVSFNTTMANYSVAIVGEDARLWTVQNIGSSGFTINSNSSTLLTGNVYWTATPHSNP